jgi:hypothetical protein
VKTLGCGAFSECGVTQVSVSASLRQMGGRVFSHTPLKVLDLSACGGIRVDAHQPNSLVELSLPRQGFAAAAMAFLPGSTIEVVRAGVGEAEIKELLPRLEGWGLSRLRIVSPRVGEYEWRRVEQSMLVELTDPVAVTTPAVVMMTVWRNLPVESSPFLRVIDLSGWTVEVLPDGATLMELVWLEGAVLPTGLRKLPEGFFRGCWRLASIDTRYTALEEIKSEACDGCRSLAAFGFPPTVRSLGEAFEGTSITTLDLSGTVAETVYVHGMIFLVDLVLPRRCVLVDVEGVPSLRRVTFGTSEPRSEDFPDFTWHPTEMRFDGLAARAESSPSLLEARLYGEVACQMGCETLPFPPP